MREGERISEALGVKGVRCEVGEVKDVKMKRNVDFFGDFYFPTKKK